MGSPQTTDVANWSKARSVTLRRLVTTGSVSDAGRDSL
jgi:hypothetical protein